MCWKFFDKKKNFITKKKNFITFGLWVRKIRDQVIIPYKIADEISEIASYFQTKNNFHENSTWCTLKYLNHKIQNKKIKSFSIIKKLGSFFDFHTKRPKLQNRGMQLLAVMLGFGGWNFAGDIIMNHIIHFLLSQLDPKEKLKFSNTLEFSVISYIKGKRPKSWIPRISGGLVYVIITDMWAFGRKSCGLGTQLFILWII